MDNRDLQQILSACQIDMNDQERQLIDDDLRNRLVSTIRYLDPNDLDEILHRAA